MGYESLIRAVPDFPRKGILFRDITPLLADPAGLRWAVDELARPFREEKIDAVVAIEARGYIFGAPLAQAMGVGFVPVRKLGKLPYETFRADYALEYGIATMEIHQDGLHKGQRALIVDDLLATGGTLRATADLVERSGASVAGVTVLIELDGLQGRSKLNGYRIAAVMKM